jgi:hypothetical protein
MKHVKSRPTPVKSAVDLTFGSVPALTRPLTWAEMIRLAADEHAREVADASASVGTPLDPSGERGKPRRDELKVFDGACRRHS